MLQRPGSGVRVAAAAAGLLAVATAIAQGDPLELRTMLFFKIMTYDANLPAGDTLRVGVVYPTARKPVAELAAVEQAFAKFTTMTVKGRKIEVLQIGYKSAGEVEALATHHKLYALFLLSAVPASDVSALKKAAASQQMFTFAVEPDLVKVGIGAGVDVVDRKPQIIVNLTAMDTSGRKIDTALLKLCQIVR